MNLGRIKVGDVVLYKRRKKIKEWDVNSISPSERYIEIENDDWSERWVVYTDILEIIESDGSNEDGVDIATIVEVERHPVIESKFK